MRWTMLLPSLLGWNNEGNVDVSLPIGPLFPFFQIQSLHESCPLVLGLGLALASLGAGYIPLPML